MVVVQPAEPLSRPVITQAGAPSGNRKDLPITSPVTLMTPGL